MMWPTVKKSLGKSLVRAERIGRRVLGIVGMMVATASMIPNGAAANEQRTADVKAQEQLARTPVLLVVASQDENNNWSRGHRSHSSHRSHRSHRSHYSSR